MASFSKNLPYEPRRRKQHCLLHLLCLMPSLFAARSLPSPLYSAARSCVPSSSTAVVRRHRPPLSLLLSAAAIYRCRHLCHSHHRHSAVSAVSHPPLLSFPVIVRRPISQAVIIRRRPRTPPSSYATVVVRRHRRCPPPRSSTVAAIIATQLSPASLATVVPSPL
jgi:hypothetical protein